MAHSIGSNNQGIKSPSRPRHLARLDFHIITDKCAHKAINNPLPPPPPISEHPLNDSCITVLVSLLFVSRQWRPSFKFQFIPQLTGSQSFGYARKTTKLSEMTKYAKLTPPLPSSSG